MSQPQLRAWHLVDACRGNAFLQQLWMRFCNSCGCDALVTQGNTSSLGASRWFMTMSSPWLPVSLGSRKTQLRELGLLKLYGV